MLSRNLYAGRVFSRFASTHAISNPTLRQIPTRWESMPEDEREEIISLLAERQKGPWSELTPLEKQAAWYISYGTWGPRRPVLAKGSASIIVKGVLIGVAAAFGIFGLFRLVAPPLPKTMSEEWQTATNEQLDEINAEPFSGHDQVQSPPTGISAADLEDDDDE